MLLRQFLSFAIIGSAGTCAHFAVLISCVQVLSMSPILGSIAGFIVATCLNYILNYHVTFRSTNRHRESLPKFFAIATIGLCLNILIMYALMQWIHYLISQLIAAGVVLIWNFSSNRLWTFKENNFAKR